MKISKEDEVTGLIKSKWINIQYDYKPKYYKECCLQGHDEKSFWNIHPELFNKYNEDKVKALKVNAKEEKVKKKA